MANMVLRHASASKKNRKKEENNWSAEKEGDEGEVICHKCPVNCVRKPKLVARMNQSVHQWGNCSMKRLIDHLDAKEL